MTFSAASHIPSFQSIAPILPVRDMARSLAFYQQLGFHTETWKEGTDYAFATRGRLSIHLNRMDTDDFRFNPCGVYFYVADVDAYFKAVVAAGVPYLHPPQDKPWKMREFALSDPDQTLLRFGRFLED